MTQPAVVADTARYIDHTVLKADSSRTQVEQLCAEALEYGFASVCVNPCYVGLCANLLKSSRVKVCTVIGFPLGANSSVVKAFEAKQAVQEGATEIDMVVNVGAIKSVEWELVENDIRLVANEVHQGGAILKVILETCLLTDEEKKKACEICKSVGADFVKTSTGFGTGGATAADVALMRQTVGPDMGVKASGGIRTLADANKMIAAGATRLGCSSGVTIMKEALGMTTTRNESTGNTGY
eukprot:scaffold34593_cov179-Amphora_coffeaeformis.AAC.9